MFRPQSAEDKVGEEVTKSLKRMLETMRSEVERSSSNISTARSTTKNLEGTTENYQKLGGTLEESRSLIRDLWRRNRSDMIYIFGALGVFVATVIWVILERTPGFVWIPAKLIVKQAVHLIPKTNEFMGKIAEVTEAILSDEEPASPEMFVDTIEKEVAEEKKDIAGKKETNTEEPAVVEPVVVEAIQEPIKIVAEAEKEAGEIHKAENPKEEDSNESKEEDSKESKEEENSESNEEVDRSVSKEEVFEEASNQITSESNEEIPIVAKENPPAVFEPKEDSSDHSESKDKFPDESKDESDKLTEEPAEKAETETSDFPLEPEISKIVPEASEVSSTIDTENVIPAEESKQEEIIKDDAKVVDETSMETKKDSISEAQSTKEPEPELESMKEIDQNMADRSNEVPIDANEATTTSPAATKSPYIASPTDSEPDYSSGSNEFYSSSEGHFEL